MFYRIATNSDFPSSTFHRNPRHAYEHPLRIIDFTQLTRLKALPDPFIQCQGAPYYLSLTL